MKDDATEKMRKLLNKAGPVKESEITEGPDYSVDWKGRTYHQETL